jgi:4-amino-4-deoxy-L-arabinose transferase-like glycosyltransferase
MLVSFGAATLFHRYYTVMMAPAIAALSGVGLVQLWQAAVQRKRSGWILFAAFPLMAMFAITMAWSYPELRMLLALIIGGFATASLIALVLILLRQNVPYSICAFAMITCLLALLAGPFVWSATPAILGATGSDPIAGPELVHRHISDPEAMEDEKLTDFLLAHYVKGGFLVATPKAQASSPFILDTGLPIMTLGGYSGSDPILSQHNLQLLAQKGAIKYFLVPKAAMLDKNSAYVKWVQQHCRIIEVSEYNTSSKLLLNSLVLYQYTDQPFNGQNINGWSAPAALNYFSAYDHATS